MLIEDYRKHASERQAQGIPARPLDPSQATELCSLLEAPPTGTEALLLDLLENHISPGVDPAARVKAEFLAELVTGRRSSALLSKQRAVQILGTMLGGYNVAPLIGALGDPELVEAAASALSNTILVYDAFDQVAELAQHNAAARKVLDSWARGQWFTSRPELPRKLVVKVFKVDGLFSTRRQKLFQTSGPWIPAAYRQTRQQFMQCCSGGRAPPSK